ncbi:hypothetical protein Acr_00g0025730 [Actinidia rufa]|uniref:Uncharacterized protein n=1 Tax=Actinidia rufa TaxID=165716 RepID=A0A7J0DFC0_9ERIC|nr:hypothetical protein Acr_00g0025730 [Actinidia rufa]
MSKRLSLKKLAQRVEGSKDLSSVAKSTSAAKGVIIQEKCPRYEVPDISPSKTGSKGKESMPPSKAKKKSKPTATPSTDTSDKVTRPVAPGEGTSANLSTILGPRASILESPSVAEKILGEFDLNSEEQVALTKKIAIEEFKSSEDFQEAVEATASKYFGEGFDIYKRQIAHHNPDLGFDLEGMSIDHNLLKEEEAEEEKNKNMEKGEENGDTSLFSP